MHFLPIYKQKFTALSQKRRQTTQFAQWFLRVPVAVFVLVQTLPAAAVVAKRCLHKQSDLTQWVGLAISQLHSIVSTSP